VRVRVSVTTLRAGRRPGPGLEVVDYDRHGRSSPLQAVEAWANAVLADDGADEATPGVGG
jgi:hypothetical protein